MSSRWRLHAKSGKSLAVLQDLAFNSTIGEVKQHYRQIKPALYPERQSYRTEAKGKMLKDNMVLNDIGLGKGGKLYFKDLGPQVGWTTVFLTEYAGPLFIYLLFYSRPAIIYGVEAAKAPMQDVVHYACLCWTGHYAKRLLETMFVHRFSNATMPIMNIFKNSLYYWGFAAFVAYFVNHPLYTAPMYGSAQIFAGLGAMIFCEVGNLSVHVALRNLRPAGSKERKIPYATSNPLTCLFSFVSCPNYTYEVGAWVSFSVMTQCLPALMFTFAGFYQMAVWAGGKHRNYVREFKNYPRGRKPIIPFLM
jgi:very-long-chain enoyl-CoA reductase